MSEYEGMERMAGDGLVRPAAANSVPGSGNLPASHAHVAQTPRVLARMPDMGPETAATASEEPAPSAHEGRLVGTGISVNVLVGGVLVLLLLALVPFLFTKNNNAGRSESPAPNASEAARWNGSNAQVSNWPAPISPDSGHANDNSLSGNRASAPGTGFPPTVTPAPGTTAWTPPGTPSIPPASVAAAEGNRWNSQTSHTMTADANNTVGNGNRSATWPTPPNAGETAADHAATGWGDPSQSVATASADPNRPVGPMMPTLPAVHTGPYEAARPAAPYQSNSAEPSAYMADARGNAAAAPSSYPNADTTGTGAAYPNAANAYPNAAANAYPNAAANAYPNAAANGLPPSNNQPNPSPSNGYPPSSNSPGGYPSYGYPNSALPPSGNPNDPSGGNLGRGMGPANANPPGGYPSGYPNSANPSSGYPNAADRQTVYPSNAYPNGVNPQSGYPNSGYPQSVNPSGG